MVHFSLLESGLELDHLALLLLVSTQYEMLATLQGNLSPLLALRALHPQHYLLGCLGLLVEDWLRLASITPLLRVVPPLALYIQLRLSSFVLGDFEELVLFTVLAKCPSAFRYVNHFPLL